MLAIGIHYLNGFVAAAAPDAHDEPEWPPHPGRLFLALAAAHFQTGGQPAEREVLLFLEKLGPPRIRAGDAWPRRAVTHYVPVNDKAGDRSKPPTAPVQSAPQIARDRQPRTFARAWLQDDVVILSWPEVELPRSMQTPLASLCAKVTRVGHSTSLVQMWVVDAEEVGAANWIPDDERPAVYLRMAAPGTLEDLERRFAADDIEEYCRLQVAAADDSDKREQRAAKARLRAEFSDGSPPRLRPELPLTQGYAPSATEEVESAVPGTVFSPHLTLLALEPESGPYGCLDLHCVPQLVDGWRKALLRHSDDLPESACSLLSGHGVSGDPLEAPHLAFVPLAFVGHEHADGRVLGMGIALPHDIARSDRRHVMRAIGRVRRLVLGRLGVWQVTRLKTAAPPWNLRPENCTAHPRGASCWATVTPVVYDRHPKVRERTAYQREVGAMIARACVRVGLPEPHRVTVTPVSAHLGVPPAHAFPRLQRKDGSLRRHVHAVIEFPCPVRGPIMLGAGRYRGYGVCRPVAARGVDG